MSFLNPAGLWGLIAIPVLILIYIIKPKFQEKLVTSTFIWKLSQKYKKKSLPWQVTNLLLFLVQLVTIAAISLVLARPVIVTEDGASEKIVILDASASMQVEGSEGSFFEKAKAEIAELAEKVERSGKMTVIYAGQESSILVERSGEERKIKELVAQTECTYGEADVTGAFLLAEEVLTENPEAQVYFYTDKEYEKPGAVKVVDVSEESWNVAVCSMEASKAENRELVFTAEVVSYGMDTKATAVLYIDDVLADARIILLPADTTMTVEFDDLGIRQYETAKLYVEATDAIAEDNEYHLLSGQEPVYEVLVVSEESTFLEAALQTFHQLDVTVVTSFDELDLEDEYLPDGTQVEYIPSTGYDLYVYDEVMPKELPGDGAVWLLYPERVPKGVTFKLGDTVFADAYLEKAPDSGSEQYALLTNQVSVDEVYISEYLEISSALGFETIYTCDGAPVVLAGETEDVKAVLFAFDLHASNIALRIAFPTMIYNMVEYSLCPILEETIYDVGETITFQKTNGAVLTTVTDSDENVQNHVWMPVSFTAETPGLYTVTQLTEEGTETTAEYFVRLSAEESNITAMGSALPELEGTGETVQYEKEITWWIVIAVLALILLEGWLQYREQLKGRRLSLIVHAVIALLLVVLLLDVKIYRSRDEINTIILADLSASTEDSYNAVSTYVEELVSSAEKKNRIGVVTYAKDALYVSELSADGEPVLTDFFSSEELPEAAATNLEEALYYAESLLEDNENQRIIVISDGLQTDGDALAAAGVLAERGVQVDAVCIPTWAVGYEMQVTGLHHPENPELGETVELKAVVRSNYAGAAELQFLDNGLSISKRIVNFNEGLTEVTTEYTPESFGVHELSAKVVPIQDDVWENNTAYSWLEVGGRGNILLVDGTGREASLLEELLSEDYSVTVIEPSEAAGYANQLAAYNGVILMNVSNADLPEGFDVALDTYIKKYGGGLLTSGGGNTYAYGDMEGTAFEALLPVTLEKGEEQTTAMMIVVDTSSSMQGLNHQMAIAGTTQCIETLAETDYVGVLTFDRTVNVIYELTSMEYEDAILEAVEQIELGRGTYMTDATEEAYDQLKDFEADNKHVIILSDGEPQDSGYIRVVKQMAANGITVSAIAVGRGADRRIMQVIAETGGGNYYNASSVNDLPDIMVEEAVAAIDSYRQTGIFPISVASYSTLLGGLEAENLPAVSGYMTTFLKTGAEQYLTVNGGEPLYVQWEYGTGKVGSFTADLRGSDSKELYTSEDGRQLIKNMLSAVIRSDGTVTALQVEATKGNNTATVDITTELVGKESLAVTVLSPDGSEQVIETSLTIGGTYQGELDISQPGVYTITVTRLAADGSLLDFAQKYLAASYSAEYDTFSTEGGETLLQQVCETTGGKMSYTASGVVEFEGKYLEQEIDLTVIILITVLVLFLFCIAAGKFRLRWFKTQKTNKNM